VPCLRQRYRLLLLLLQVLAVTTRRLRRFNELLHCLDFATDAYQIFIQRDNKEEVKAYEVSPTIEAFQGPQVEISATYFCVPGFFAAVSVFFVTGGFASFFAFVLEFFAADFVVAGFFVVDVFVSGCFVAGFFVNTADFFVFCWQVVRGLAL
jgi:hypothetical protein